MHYAIFRENRNNLNQHFPDVLFRNSKRIQEISNFLPQAVIHMRKGNIYPGAEKSYRKRTCILLVHPLFPRLFAELFSLWDTICQVE